MKRKNLLNEKNLYLSLKRHYFTQIFKCNICKILPVESEN